MSSLVRVIGRLRRSRSLQSGSGLVSSLQIRHLRPPSIHFYHTNAKATIELLNRRAFSTTRHYTDVPNRSRTGQSYVPDLPILPKTVPTKQELLARASGFLDRLKIRSKWALTRSNRPFRADDYSAFFSWFVFAHIFWIIAGTTTFVSLGLVAINTLSAQEYLASKVGDYLTSSSGVTVVFENAIVPQWKGGCITFSNVFVSRRPKSLALPAGVRKGTLSEATAEAAAKRSPLLTIPGSLSSPPVSMAADQDAEDTNYTQFDLTIETANVTLSFIRWWNGKGLLQSIELKGVRGVVDRTFVHWDSETAAKDPLSFRHEPNYGDFELDSFKLDDLLVTVHQPQGFRPFTASIFSCDLPRLRRRYLFYDLLCANHISGSYDNSLITLHPKQSFSTSAATLANSSALKRESRFRLDGIRIDHINKGVSGPMGWIHEGTCDIVADITIPADSPNSTIVDEVISNIAESVHPHLANSILSEGTLAATTSTIKAQSLSIQSSNRTPPEVEIDVRFRLNDARAKVPLVQHDLSYINATLVRPIVGYINSRKTFIPIHAVVTLPVDNFEGSWTWWDCGLQSQVSVALYEAFVEGLYERRKRRRRMQAVGFWSLQMVAQLLMMSLKNVVPSTG